MTVWCVEVGPVANAREGSVQEHNWAKVEMYLTATIKHCSNLETIIQLLN